jgi:sec-independent protein translocase protein TatA
MAQMLAIGLPGGPFEWMLIFGIGLLLFGKRLPDIARGAGRSIVEFKKGLRDIDATPDIEQPKLPDASRQPPAH